MSKKKQKQPVELPKLVKAAVVADAIDTTTPQVYKMAADGRVPSHRFGNMVRFDVEEIRQWIETHRRAA